MTRIRTVLVPHDFSVGADRALDQAVALARRLGSSIRLLHCYRVPTELELLYLGQPTEHWEPGIREAVARQLAEVAARVTGQGITIIQELVRGQAATEIVRAASTDTDLIVMGTLGRTGLGHLLLGSVAERAVREAPCPVLVVRPQEAAVGLPRTVILPVDFSVGADRALAFVRETFGGWDGFRVVLVHANDTDDLPQVPVPDRDSLCWALQKFAPKELCELAGDLKEAGLQAEVRIESGSPVRVIADCARKEQADWIVMSSHGRSGPSRWILGSVAERVLRTAPCSVLVLRSPRPAP